MGWWNDDDSDAAPASTGMVPYLAELTSDRSTTFAAAPRHAPVRIIAVRLFPPEREAPASGHVVPELHELWR